MAFISYRLNAMGNCADLAKQWMVNQSWSIWISVLSDNNTMGIKQLALYNTANGGTDSTNSADQQPVSYTHLTLPTIYSV